MREELQMKAVTGIEESALTVVPIHQHPEFLKECCDLVNQEWPRSETARMMSLKASCDKMPTSLVLLSGNKKVIGHCKLTPIPSIKESCFVESVVIDKSLRGKGLGTFLMNASELYCKSVLNLSMIHLSTKGQEFFYKKLGYAECEPVTIYGSFSYQSKNSPVHKPQVNQTINTNQSPLAGPPPPPMPPKKEQQTNQKSNKTYMVKSIA